MKKEESSFKFYFLLTIRILFILTLIIMYIYGSRFYKVAEEILKWNYSPLVFLGLYFVSSFFPIPFLTFVGSAVYPFFEIFIYSIIGNFITMTAVFFISRFLGKDYVQRWEQKNKTIRELDMKFKKNAFLDIILLRCFFIIPPEIINFIAGLSQVKYWEYISASVLGMIPVSLASIMLIKGRMIQSNLMITAAIIMFILLIVIPIIYVAAIKKFVKKRYAGVHHHIHHHYRKLRGRARKFFNRKHGKKLL